MSTGWRTSCHVHEYDSRIQDIESPLSEDPGDNYQYKAKEYAKARKIKTRTEIKIGGALVKLLAIDRIGSKDRFTSKNQLKTRSRYGTRLTKT